MKAPTPEPSAAERADWPDATRAYVEDLEASDKAHRALVLAVAGAPEPYSPATVYVGRRWRESLAVLGVDEGTALDASAANIRNL